MSPAAPLRLRNVRPYGEGEPVDVLVVDGVVAAIGPDAGDELPDPASGREVETHDFGGAVLLPGLVDLHTHLREPGREDTETIATGSAAAVRGGYTAVFAMANTQPAADNQTVTDSVWRIGREVGLCDVHPVGAVTVGLAGERLTEMGQMASGEARVRVFSDDGRCVHDPLVMRRALEYSAGLGVLVAQHAEEPRLTVGAVAHEGPTAARLGLTGWPRSAEESIVARDVLLARDAGARVHICHASTTGTVELLRWARAQGIRVTAEVTPHHLLLDDTRLEGYDGVYRVNPPLREEHDTLALRQALLEGVVDCVATDHAPHAAQEKCCEFAAARPGMLGLETALPIVAALFVETGDMTWRDVARVTSERPAEIAGLTDQGRPIAVGEPAEFAVVDPDAPWSVRAEELASLSANTPYAGMSFSTRVVGTVHHGRLVQSHGEVRA